MEATRKAKEALAAHDPMTARSLALEATRLDPGLEDAWLMLAAVSPAEEALQYLSTALHIHPESPRALKGIAWARERLETARKKQTPANIPEGDNVLSGWQPENLPNADTLPISETVLPVAGTTGPYSWRAPVKVTARRVAVLPWVLSVMILCLTLAAWFFGPTLWQTLNPPAVVQVQPGVYTKPTLTPTPTSTFTPTPTFTATVTASPTPTATNTPTPTNTPEPTATTAPTATALPPVVYVEENNVYTPAEMPVSTQRERWIDVDLSQQRVYAYEGQNVVKQFTVSTGTSAHPTVTGRYYIYVKYRYDDMAGPGYYLPDVPYVMYFYEGYSFHGTYWHSNFGTPMSHGCVNLRTEDAAWLYNWADVGTLVNVHQ